MPGSYSFSNLYSSGNFLSQTQFSTGAGLGIDFPVQFWAQGASFHFGNNDVRIVPVALRAGQTINLDLDYGVGGIDNIDPRITIVNSSGTAVSTISSSASLDNGTVNVSDPRGTFTAAVTGMYFIAVSHQANVYVNNSFKHNNAGTDGGDYVLNLGFSTLTAYTPGTTGDDSLTLGLTELRYDALAGNDYVQTSTNGTTVDGGAGNDILYGSDGSDILSGGDDNDGLYGYNNADVLIGGNGLDNMYGGLGNDELFGGETYDYLYGEEGNDILYGEGDYDNLYGGGNHDKLYGGADGDYLDGGLGNDLLDGGDGQDTGYYFNAIGNTMINLNIAGPQITGMGTDTLVSVESLTGGNFQDTFIGTNQSNYFYGNGGNDSLTGNGAYDQLYGHAGNDTLRGGADGDYIYGGDGLDHLYGGTGVGGDVFRYQNIGESTLAQSDRIYDFSSAEFDNISLSSVNPGTLVFLGAGPFTGTSAEVRVVVAGAFQAVYVDNDADAVADMRILVQSATTLAASDFNL
jgi:Ca2+-binding RTX toxin-like protein